MQGRQKLVFDKLITSSGIVTVSFFAAITFLYLYAPVKVNPIVIPASLPMVVDDVTTPKPVINVPTTLKIKNINVEASINPVGVTPVGNMDIDENPKQLAWYKFGPKPGEKGSAVIAGHYGWKDTIPSVFNDLNRLAKGDTITTYDAAGNELIFVVVRTELYAPDQDATKVFRSDDGNAHLNLITCQGSWNNSSRTYSERLVVFTDLVK